MNNVNNTRLSLHHIVQKRVQRYCFFLRYANVFYGLLGKNHYPKYHLCKKKVGVVSRQRPTFVSRGGKTSLLNTKPPQIANQ